MYIYLGHTGSLYATDEPLDYESRFCETCGDFDILICCAETLEEALEFFDEEEWNMEIVTAQLKAYFI